MLLKRVKSEVAMDRVNEGLLKLVHVIDIEVFTIEQL